MSFPRYPNYKDSGVDWIDTIPDTWTPTRLRFLLREGYDGLKIGPFGSQLTSEMLEEGGAYKVYGQENIIANDFARGSRLISDEKFRELSVYEIIPGDLLITMMGTSGRCDVAPPDMVPGIMDSHLLRMRVTTSVRADFVRLLIDEAAYVGTQIYLAGKGSIMHGLNSSIVKDLLLFVPPAEDQDQILAFLDRETAKIDGLVGEQRRLMELLKEKRQAVISHAVTKGMNPHAPMKPSGIEWLGDVPEHWDGGVKLKTLAQKQPAAFTNGPFGSDLLTSELQEEGVPVIYIRDLKVDGYRRSSTSYVTAEKAIQLDKFRVDERDVLIAKVGDPPGFCCTYPEGEPPGIICQDVIRMKPNLELVSSNYLCFLLNSPPGIEAIDSICVELTRKRFSLADLHSLRLPLPPRPEQEEIAQWLTKVIGEFKALTAEAQRAIDLLQERRTALISAAVTGQIDVRPH